MVEVMVTSQISKFFSLSLVALTLGDKALFFVSSVRHKTFFFWAVSVCFPLRPQKINGQFHFRRLRRRKLSFLSSARRDLLPVSLLGAP